MAKGALARAPTPAAATAPGAAAKDTAGPGAGAGGQGPQGQKLRVCAACGAFLSITDSEQRLMDHFEGALWLGCKGVWGRD